MSKIYLCSATDLAIALADEAGTLRLVTRPSRFGGYSIAFEDHVGVIEVRTSAVEANARLEQIRAHYRKAAA